MGDIRQENSESCVTFIGESARAKEWMVKIYHESKVKYSLDTKIELAQAERFLKKAREQGFDLPDLPDLPN